jgi:hypothetical protein
MVHSTVPARRFVIGHGGCGALQAGKARHRELAWDMRETAVATMAVADARHHNAPASFFVYLDFAKSARNDKQNAPVRRLNRRPLRAS